MENIPSTSMKVINYILEQVKSKRFVEGCKLPTETELSSSLNVGRNSVREALKTLQFLGLVDSTRGSGYTLTPSFENCACHILQFLFEMMNYQSSDVRHLREALDLKTLQLIQKQRVLQDSDISMLNDCVERMDNGISPREADWEFHCILSKMSGNSLMHSISEALSQVATSYIDVPWENISYENKKKLVKCHRDIIAHLRKNDSLIDPRNVITAHYNWADRLAAEKNFGDYSLRTVSELLDEGKTEEEILLAIRALRYRT